MRVNWLHFTLILLFGLGVVVHAQTAPLSTTEEVMAAFIKANGGEEGIEEVRSIRARGTVLIDGETRTITLLRKRPGKKRVTIGMDGFKVHQGFNGKESWQMFEADNGARKLNIMEGAEKEEFERDRFILGRLFLTAEDGVEHNLIGVEYVGRVPCYVIESTYKGDVRRSYMDSRTLRVLKFEYAASTEGQELVVETLSNYTQMGKIWIARTSRREIDGEFSGEVTLDRLELNNGVFDRVFDPPVLDTKE
jgi:hypothetical protein